MTNVKKLLMAAAGASGDSLGIDSVFKTHTYKGTAAENEQDTGIDMATEGGMVWIKRFTDGGAGHNVFDTVRGRAKRLAFNLNNQEFTSTASQDFKSFDSDGFTLNGTLYNANLNANTTYPNTQYISYNFRKCANFFDIVTFTGDGASSKTLSHSLGVAPAWILVKRRDDSSDWWCYHRMLNGGTNPHQYRIAFNQENDEESAGNTWGNTAPTASNFYVGDNDTNTSSATYVAYLWAHHPNDGSSTGFGSDGTTPTISCGGYTGNGNATGPSITTGFEPQWLLLKNIDDNYNTWYLFDRMRGFGSAGKEDAYLRPNEAAASDVGAHYLMVKPDGFQVFGTGGHTNGDGDNYIYIAVSRGGDTEPTDIDDVFDSKAYDTDNTDDRELDTTNRADLMWGRAYEYSNSYAHSVQTRLIQSNSNIVRTNSTSGTVDNPDGISGLQQNKGFRVGNDTNVQQNNGYQKSYGSTWTRAKGFFDERAYYGTGSTQTLTHSLGTEPKMILIKEITGSSPWTVYHTSLGNQYAFNLSSSGTPSQHINWWRNYTPTATNFKIGAFDDHNQSGQGYMCLLFGEISGLTKFGSYTGNGSATGPSITTGFQPQWVLIRRYDDSGKWMLFDAARGVASGNDSVLYFNETDQAFAGDYIDFNSSNFQLKNTDGDINANSGTYIYYAIGA